MRAARYLIYVVRNGCHDAVLAVILVLIWQRMRHIVQLKFISKISIIEVISSASTTHHNFRYCHRSPIHFSPNRPNPDDRCSQHLWFSILPAQNSSCAMVTVSFWNRRKSLFLWSPRSKNVSYFLFDPVTMQTKILAIISIITIEAKQFRWTRKNFVQSALKTAGRFNRLSIFCMESAVLTLTAFVHPIHMQTHVQTYCWRNCMEEKSIQTYLHTMQRSHFTIVTKRLHVKQHEAQTHHIVSSSCVININLVVWINIFTWNHIFANIHIWNTQMEVS